MSKTPTGTETYSEFLIPFFENKKVFVASGSFYQEAIAMMASAGFTRAESVDEADLVVFLGGSDVNPALYGERPLAATRWHPIRDEQEKALYDKCRLKAIPMFGICRGAQFLHVMNDGSLWQDVNNHAGNTHYIYDIDEDVRVLSNSLHHQMIMFDPEVNMELIATCESQIATTFKAENLFIDIKEEGKNALEEVEVEAASYPMTGCFVVQGHPEISGEEYRSWCLHKLYDFLTEWNQANAT